MPPQNQNPFDLFNQPQGKLSSNKAPILPPPGGEQQNPWALLSTLLGQSSGYNPQAEAQADAHRLSALRNDPQHDANMGYAPGMDSAANPFSNGFFKSGAGDLSEAARLASQGPNAMNQWAMAGQNPNVSPDNLGQLNQLRHDTIMNNVHPNYTPTQRFAPAPPFMAPQMQQPIGGNGFEFMLNPNVPDAQKYQDGNFARVSPFVNLPPGAVMGDGTTNYRRQFGASGSPQPGTNFGNLR